MVKLPNSVVWQLTKKNNSFLVKFNGQTFSHDPLNLTGLHNASQAGLSNDQSVGLQAQKVKSKKGALRGAVNLLQRHKSHNKITKRRKNSTSGAVYSSQVLKRGVNRIGRVVKNLTHISERVRRLALKRVQKLHVASRSQVKGGAAKKTEKK
ncbi:60s ribosomal protein l28 [Stylonychia lemnae]|uniref:60s ribosomal protein l28 n=1 Tax=Stylonychia lemnae TaxID=5949 RepID=A0A078AFP6_STYLE|nr:60s ribosomal protein l28 [Stylonychia lemnae]|eukprot:CDW81060.1 60s ribosomal protein l28 [Stylonychia lemnae]